MSVKFLDLPTLFMSFSYATVYGRQTN